MPDPISLPTAPIGLSYEPEANACVAASPAAPPAASPPPQPSTAPSPALVAAGAQQLIDGYAGARAAAGEGEGAKASDCKLETLRAAVICGQMVATTVASAPTVVGAVLTGFFGGVACGMASAEAYECYRKQP